MTGALFDDEYDDQSALFGVQELRPDTNKRAGRVEAGTLAALRKGESDGVVIDLDAGLAAAALATARRLDEADRIGSTYGDLKAGYLFAQLVGPFRELMQALRLPAEVQPAEDPRPPAAGSGGTGVPAWLNGLAGEPE